MVFSTPQFYEIYSEKVAFYDEKHQILEIRITMGSTDDSNDHLHVIRMAFKDIQGQVFNSKKELLEYLGYGENSRKRNFNGYDFLDIVR